MTQALTARRWSPTGTRPWPLDMPDQSSLQEILHEPYESPRERVILALNDSAFPTHRRWALNLASCCHTARFYVDADAGQVRPFLARCRSRLCPLCGRRRSQQVARQIQLVMSCMKDPRIVILTVRSSDRPLGEQLRSLRRSFAKLRRRPFWKKHVTGGLYCVEVTRNDESGKWHPHLHILVDGTYLPQKLLQYHWHEVTGGSKVVWIQRVTDHAQAAWELAKYIGKPQRVCDWPDRQIRDYASATSGSRMVQTFGSIHGSQVKDRDHEHRPGDNEYSVTLPNIVWLANQGHATPQRLSHLIATRYPIFSSYIWHKIPQLSPPELQVHKTARFLAKLRGTRQLRQATSGGTPDVEALDKRLFSTFTRYRLEAQNGLYERPPP